MLLTALKRCADDNAFTALPDCLWEFTRLTTLNLSTNRLSALPDQIGQLASLTDLDLRFNRLTALLIGGRVAVAARSGAANERAERTSRRTGTAAEPGKLDLRWNRLPGLLPGLQALQERGCLIYT